MNKKALWIIGAVVVIAAAAGAFFYFNQTPGGIATIGNTSLRSLLAGTASQKCTFDNGESSGTIYVGAGKMRGDFTSKTGEATAQSHMVVSNNMTYIWIDGMNQGYRMPFEDMSGSGASNGQGIDADARVATNCEPWQANEAMFALPTDVTFNALPSAASTQQNTPSADTSAAAAASEGKGGPATYAEQQCAACNMITDPTAKAQCIASFDCPAN